MSSEADAKPESFAKDLDVTMEGQESSGKVYRLDEVASHNNEQDLWMAIHNKVYDVTKFTDEHPGGIEVLLDYAGMEATYAFEDVGHSLDARDLLAQYYIGDLHEDDRTEKAATAETEESGSGSSSGMIMLGLAAAVMAVGAFFMFGDRTW